MIEKILERLEETRWTTIFDAQCVYENAKLDSCIKIVQEVAKEYGNASDSDLAVISALPSLYPLQPFEEEAIHRVVAFTKDDGWVSCSERLPNDEEMKRAYCRNKFGFEFIVMIEGANRPTTLYRTLDGFWVDDSRNVHEVIAWQPLPSPYQQGEQATLSKA